MRNIRFRAWNLNLKRMLQVYDAKFVNGEMIGANDYDSKTIVMQFTGLHDKNGKEIYENDIVISVGYGNLEIRGSRKVVSWNRNISGWNVRPAKYTVVLGNIFENPELIK